ncbi:hypothetical protein BDU57DRAFT_489241 [Ampelomyces quisqualis]|uniref:Utp8 beta-propeller domain-containing protein n=1 Tax=Ampelomyces quisqualis TaxID=50730 RepID=A0A6A5R6D4_AMPQU|nr:hypothetical protein BDU57DRAFT_489241 [Ampelomyces quisqualis]
MSSGESIGAPFTLAALSKPVGSTNGRTHAASVCSFAGIKKRKRTEIAVGLDGEGVSIYSLENPQLVTSYALPPSTAFTLAPFSIYRKSSSKGPSQRFTYASVTGSAQTDKLQLVCFHEKSLGDRTETSKSAHVPSADAQILALDALPVASGGPAKSPTHDILATFDNGQVTCLSADLETVRWVANLDLLEIGSSIEHVSTATAKAVTRGLLRSREDVASVLNAKSDKAPDLQHLTQVLCVVGRRPNQSITLSLFQVVSRSQDLNTTPLSPLKHLVSWQLPNSGSPSSNTSNPNQYSLHASSGTLNVLKGATILSYNLSDTVPTLYSELSVPGVGLDSFLRLSQDLLFTTFRQTCRILDTKFNTLQASQSLDTSSMSVSASPAKKRKLSQPETTPENAAVRLLAYYSEHDLVVALRQSDIIGMQLNDSLTHSRARHDGTLLCDALGKGFSSSSAHGTQKWHERKSKLDKLASKGKIDKFEAALAAYLGIEVEISRSQAKQENELNGGPLTNSVGPRIPDEDAMAIDLDQDKGVEDYSMTWKLPRATTNDRKLLYRQCAPYALSKIFRATRVGEDGETSKTVLRVQFFPENVFRWLLQTGNLSAASIRRAILEEVPEDTEFSASIVDGDIVKSLVDFDPELHILSDVLNYSGHLPIGEVVQAVKALMQSLDERPATEEPTKLLTNGTAPLEPEMDVDITSELDAATYEVEHALSVLDHGLLIRRDTLRPALFRLHTFSPRVVTSTLRTMLPRRDLESLINVLHSQLNNGGWSSSFDSSEPEDLITESSSEAPDDHAVAVIASLLSCTIDAIGAGAWLASVGSSVESDTDRHIIDTLQSDTSIVLTGFWEARYMRGLLGEFLRFASSVPKSHKPSGKTLESQGKPFTVIHDDGELPMLPMGGKPEMGVEKMKAGKGKKKEQRSQREIGMMISRKVPKYSFERIVI